MTDLGTGIGLDREFDVIVDTTGDLDFASGELELFKDLAYKITETFEPYIGEPNQFSNLHEVELLTQRVINADPRVDRIRTIDVTRPEPPHIKIYVELYVGDEIVDNVFVV